MKKIIASRTSLDETIYGTPDPILTAKVDELLAPYLERGSFFGSIMIIKDGKAVVRKSYGLADREKGIPNTPKIFEFDVNSNSLVKAFKLLPYGDYAKRISP